MQYGADISTYKRVESDNSKKAARLKPFVFKYFILIGVGILLSRVLLSITEDIGIAPFGIAYIIGVKKENIKDNIFALIGIIIGYISIMNKLEGALGYCIVAGVIVFYNEVCDRINYKKREMLMFILVFSTFLLFNILVYSKPMGVNLMVSSLKLISIIPVKYIIKYAFSSIDELESNYFFQTEEIISIGILICLLVAGFGDINFFDIYLRNIVGIFIISLFAYVGGMGVGATVGIAMGLVIGITNNNIATFVTLYSLCGLMVGLFKETGRIFSSIAFIVVNFIILMYDNSLNLKSVIEVIIPLVAFIALPNKFIEYLVKEFNQEKKAEVINDGRLNGVKNEFVERLNLMKGLMSTLSKSISNLGENDILSLNNKGTAMVESLADRVCSNCELKQRCWDRNLHVTFEGFSELISSCENNDIYFPKNLESKCVKKRSLMKSSQEIVNNYTVNEALKTRLTEGRKLIASHINSISRTMGEMIHDFEKDITICSEIDKVIKKSFKKNKIEYKDVFCYLDRKGRMKIKVMLDNCEGCNYCHKNILPIINSLVKVPVSIAGDGCKIDPNTGECSIIIEETPKYQMTSYAAVKPKEGETFIGDSYSFNKNEDGTYLTIISDGMGSGPEASSESKLAVDLIESFIESGFSESTAINTVNSIMTMKFNEDEKFTTMDLSLVDLYTGEAEFIKVGGVASFIKNGDRVRAIRSNSLPFGILDSVDINSEKVKLSHGDIVISITDGILDIDKSDVGNYSWLMEYLKYADNNPSALSRDILEKATVLSGGIVKDDMTVLVSKVYSVY
ncbi:stage II sporulation protein E [Clostridium sp.]|uniref:stage II sporulation protein E n=1 Tax=Clostridium sp. TaxID=1506 RepID=UPI00262B7BD6|nr:stage II sporulation protein E [Clostridium sp.]